jgi:anaphase-promoting complex subunit 4
MLTIIYNSITYDENYDPEDLAESVCSYAEALPGQEMEVVTRCPFDAGFIPVRVTVNGGLGKTSWMLDSGG